MALIRRRINRICIKTEFIFFYKENKCKTSARSPPAGGPPPPPVPFVVGGVAAHSIATWINKKHTQLFMFHTLKRRHSN